MRLASKHSSWLVVLGSTAGVACSVYTSDLLVQDDAVKPGPSATTATPAASSDAPGPSTRPSSAGTDGSTSTPSSARPSSDASLEPTTSEPTGSPDGGGSPTSEPSGESDGGIASSADPTTPSTAAASVATSVPSAPPDPTIIDDFEDGNTRILVRAGRTGYWFTSAADPEDDLFTITDATTAANWVLAPEPTGDANDTKKAAHVIATGISADLGSHAELGVNFINPSGGSNVEYPAAADYLGIAFRARIGEDAYDDDATDSAQWIRFALPLSSTEADSDHYTKDFLVNEEWAEYVVLWADDDLIQQGFGDAVEFEPAKATALQFKLINPATGFDLWVDDIRFVAMP